MEVLDIYGPVVSEQLEPAITSAIGVLWRRSEEAGHTRESLQILWHKSSGISMLLVCLNKDGNCVHSSIAFGNYRSRLAKFIREKTGENPFDWDRQHEMSEQ